jgi:hypothetical protein
MEELSYDELQKFAAGDDLGEEEAEERDKEIKELARAHEELREEIAAEAAERGETLSEIEIERLAYRRLTKAQANMDKDEIAAELEDPGLAMRMKQGREEVAIQEAVQDALRRASKDRLEKATHSQRAFSSIARNLDDLGQSITGNIGVLGHIRDCCKQIAMGITPRNFEACESPGEAMNQVASMLTKAVGEYERIEDKFGDAKAAFANGRRDAEMLLTTE